MTLARLPSLNTSAGRRATGAAWNGLASQEERLRRFLGDERLPIRGNKGEWTFRHLAARRRSWLVFGSPRGGNVARDLDSLMLSYRAVAINPEAYLSDALTRVATTPMSEIASLTPLGWAEPHPEARAELV